MLPVPKTRPKIIFLVFLLLAAALFHVAIGSTFISFKEMLNALFLNQSETTLTQQIIWELRVPRMLTALLAGAGLSLAGLQMQTLFKNPLAGPDVLGLTTGAGLGVGICIFVGVSFNSILPFIPLFAFAGALLVFVLILPVAHYIRDQTTLLLIGVMVSALGNAVLGILQYASGSNKLQSFVIWTFGSLGNTTFTELGILAGGLFAGLILSLLNVKNLNVWPLGESYLKNLNIPIRRARLMMIISSCLLTSLTTAYCGPIAFVGLATPLLIRNWVNTFNHQHLIIASCLAGAVVLILCDMITHLFTKNFAIPINVATSLFGAPVVIFFIIRLKKVSI
ncbi:MAG: iron ABC transporter permease [Cyclobacteriaceae bacterium]|jgi:iron complex transport system permease protein|nr:iron ABC transporter permease [Cyclobacteriaceae bacterium]